MRVDSPYATQREPRSVVVVVGPAPEPSIMTRTPLLSIATATGMITEGALSVTLVPSPNYVGTILATPITPDSPIAAFTWNAPAGDVVGEIPYTVTIGTIYITQIR